MVPRAGLLCVALLLILAGCTGTFSPDAGTTTPGSETTTATTLSPTTPDATASDATASDATPPDTTGTTSATPATSSTSRGVRADLDAEDLSPSERELLRRAVENGSVTVARWNLSDSLTPETDGWEVRYRGTLYELSWRYEGIRGEYDLAGATRVNASEVESADDVISYENLTEKARELFDVARSGNGTDSYGAKAFPDQLRDNRYVTYDGEYYDLHLHVGDYVMYRLSVREVDA